MGLSWVLDSYGTGYCFLKSETMIDGGYKVHKRINGICNSALNQALVGCFMHL